MNKKFSLGICISLIAIGCAITFVLTMSISLKMYNDKIAGVEEREKIYSRLQEIDSFVRNNTSGTIDEDFLTDSILDGYITGLSDKNAAFYSADEYYRITEHNNGYVVGIGADYRKNSSGYIEITSVYDNSPAFLSGIQKGDVITSIDGKKVLDTGADIALTTLEGEIGTRVSLVLLRSGEEISVSLTRKQVEIRTVYNTNVDSFGYIRLSSFNALTAEYFNTAIDSLVSTECAGLVLDLRGNGSDYYDNLDLMLSRFIGAETIATAEYKNDIEKTFIRLSDDKSDFSKPIVILVDDGTAAAAELFAVSLRDFASAKLVGEETSGKCDVVLYQSYKDGTAVAITAARIIPAKTEYYGSIGIKPDFIVETDEPAETNLNAVASMNDTQIKKAFEIIATLGS